MYRNDTGGSLTMDFSDIPVSSLINADFRLYGGGPVIRPFDSPIAADPSLLTPDDSPDGKWHMFFHTLLGVYHFVSADGISFSKKKRILSRAMRPNVNRTDNGYVLFYEKTTGLLSKGLNVIGLAPWKSEIYAVKSKDLENWSAPEPVITHSKEFEKAGKGYALSNPFLLAENGIRRLYYSCGQTFIKDCGFCEPTYINYAEDRGDGYTVSDSPILCPDKQDPYLNLCSGCLKVYRFSDGYVGIQNGIYERDGKSHSAILLLTSADGLHFTFSKVIIEPGMYGNEDWMAQFVYASHLVRYNGEIRLYFNARDTSDMLKGRECIGFITTEKRFGTMPRI